MINPVCRDNVIVSYIGILRLYIRQYLGIENQQERVL